MCRDCEKCYDYEEVNPTPAGDPHDKYGRLPPGIKGPGPEWQPSAPQLSSGISLVGIEGKCAVLEVEGSFSYTRLCPGDMLCVPCPE